MKFQELKKNQRTILASLRKDTEEYSAFWMTRLVVKSEFDILPKIKSSPVVPEWREDAKELRMPGTTSLRSVPNVPCTWGKKGIRG
jgi:hypothetical protein